MSRPSPPVVTPKAPNIGVVHTVSVTSTETPQQTKSNEHGHGKPPQVRLADTISSVPSNWTYQPTRNTRTLGFTESLDQPPAHIKSKLEPRIEPPGAAYKGQGPDRKNPEIGIMSFLREYPRAQMQSIESRKNSFQYLLFGSNAERGLLFGSKQKTPGAIALKRTSDGRRYSQIVSKGLYEGGTNKSTYQVNVVDDSSKVSTGRLKGQKLGNGWVRSTKRRQSIDSLSSVGESFVIRSGQMVGGKSASLNDGREREAEMQQEANGGKQKQDCSPPLLLPLQGAAESSFGVDFSSILNRHDESTTSPKKARRDVLGAILMTRSESRPNVRGFAGEGAAKFLKSAFRHKSKSPVRSDRSKADYGIQFPPKQRDAGNGYPKLTPTSIEVPEQSVSTNHIDSIRDLATQNADVVENVSGIKARPEKQRHWRTTDPQKQSAKSGSQRSSRSSNAKGSSTSKGHSKSLSGISGCSHDNDNLSEVSSIIISDAQSMSIRKPEGDTGWSNGILVGKPQRPGPAPTAPLPSLPEGQHVQLPSTPRVSESSQSRPSPQRSPTNPRQRAPVKYRFTPAEKSPTKKPPSPTHASTVIKPEPMSKKPAALVRVQTANVEAFPSPPSPSQGNSRRQAISGALHEKLPASMSAGTLAARAESTKKLKAKAFVKKRSQTVTLAVESSASMPTTRTNPVAIEDSDGHRDYIGRLTDSYDTQQFLPSHRPLSSPMTTFSASDGDNRNNIRSSEFSPIIVVANQEPVTSSKMLSAEAPSFETTNDSTSPLTGTDLHLEEQAPAEPPDSRPASEHSLQPPQPPDEFPRRSMANRSPQKSVANRAPTPFTHPSLRRRDSYRSSQRSSLTERDLEARMVVMEKKNRWLERAFHAVMDASASISSGDDSRGRDSGNSFGTWDRFRASADDSLDQMGGDIVVREDNDEKRYAGLEDLLVRQGRRRLQTLSISSEPF